ncbi:hypothetical protein GCM10010987_78130 [Bradyrhizobium guangdongense]|uniref:Uncharacterized protein n=1 Tax=Bradyrhizobium guangdongense TaxID=1325090 RepID=A0AA87WC04_9BRAD|nr:hypothetical protein GCM10010987_78130 [Bradyrhizobium guangdongense]
MKYHFGIQWPGRCEQLGGLARLILVIVGRHILASIPFGGPNCVWSLFEYMPMINVMAKCAEPHTGCCCKSSVLNQSIGSAEALD